MDARIRALNRFGLGARPGERDALDDPRQWLEAQLRGASPELDTGGRGISPEAPAQALRALRESQRERDEEAIRQARQAVRQVAQAEARAVLGTRVHTDRPFPERLVAFWSNHLCISVAGKGILAPLAGAYEREAIRPHVLGRFEAMVLASARHPAMLLYLDQARSVGPESRAARRVARRRRGEGRAPGLNENYARELLELHTLGVDGGYGQSDVEALARVLTGWTLSGVNGPGARGMEASGDLGFAFRPPLHEPGSKTVLGVTYREGGEEEGERVIRDLCRHPSTARFVATKLVRHFVADEPPPEAVEAVSEVFRETGGDLREVARSLIRLDEAWDPGHRKFRTPQDWLVAVLRAFRVGEIPEPVGPILAQLRHPLWAPPSPKGYGDTAREWADPDALMNRAELARSIGRRFTARTGLDPRALLELVDVEADDPLRTMLADETVPVEERVSLALAGPAFQWR